jgi:hypothetical protein
MFALKSDKLFRFCPSWPGSIGFAKAKGRPYAKNVSKQRRL